MSVVDLVTVDGVVVGVASIDHDARPLPRAVLTRHPGCDAQLLADLIARTFTGHRLVMQDPELAAALLAAGAELVRASRLMVRDTSPITHRPVPPGFALRPIQDRPDEYAAFYVKAYPPEHLDHDPTEVDPILAAATIARYLAGTEIGPLIRTASAEARTSADVCVAAVFISEMAADDEFEGGPWITEVFVDPAWQGHGIGAALIAHAVAQLAAEQRATLGLAVTEGNPARRLYEALGFTTRFESWKMVLGTPAPAAEQI